MGRDWVDLLWSSIDSMKKTLIIIIVIFLLIILVTLLGGGVLYILAIPPYDGIWECNDPYIRIDATNGFYGEMEYMNSIVPVEIAYNKGGNFAIYPKQDEAETYISASDFIYTGNVIKRFGNKVYIKSHDGSLECWLNKIG